jgi:hypothetical protein
MPEMEVRAEARTRFEERTKAETGIEEVARLIAGHAPAGENALQAIRTEKSTERLRPDEEHDFSLAVGSGDPEIEIRALD